MGTKFRECSRRNALAAGHAKNLQKQAKQA
jgi:hypothetical protein